MKDHDNNNNNKKKNHVTSCHNNNNANDNVVDNDDDVVKKRIDDEIILQHNDDEVDVNNNNNDVLVERISSHEYYFNETNYNKSTTVIPNTNNHNDNNNMSDDTTFEQHDDDVIVDEDKKTNNIKKKNCTNHNSWYSWIHDQFMKQLIHISSSSSTSTTTTTTTTTTNTPTDGTKILLLLLRKIKIISTSISFKKKMTIISIMITFIISYHYNRNKIRKTSKQKLLSNHNQHQKSVLLSFYHKIITNSSSLYVILHQMLFNNQQQHNPKTTKSISLSYKNATIVPVSLLLQSIKNHYIQQILLGSNGIIYFQTNNNDNNETSSLWKRTTLPKENAIILQKDIIQQLTTNSSNRHVDIIVLPESIISFDRILSIGLSSLPFIYLYFLYRLMKTTTSGMNDDLFGISKLFHKSSQSNDKKKNNNNITFADIGGLNNIIIEVNEIVLYIKNPIQYINIGANIPKGILLYGPPGVGKTLIVNAIANESNVDCFISCSASDFVEIYVGRGASRIRSIFNTAYKQAIYNGKQKRNNNNKKNPVHNFLSKYIPSMPSSFVSLLSSSSSRNQQQQNHNDDDINNNRPYTAIIFIDELDALAKTRCHGGSGSNDERDQTLNQLLTEMDGFHSKQDNNEVIIIVIAASNRVDTLDPAIIRRFDRQIYIGYPNMNERKAILQIHSKYITLEPSLRNNNSNTSLWDDISSNEMTNEFTGCDLRNIINEAALLAVRDNSLYVTRLHIENALQKIQQMKDNIIQQQKTNNSSPIFLFPSSSS